MFNKIAIAIRKKHLENLYEISKKKGEYQYDLLEIVDEKIQREGNDYFLSVHHTIDLY